jgi:ribosomal protein S18 acetylase RimI-like enzyme
MPITVRRARSDEWESLRQIRLEMLEDTPIAFAERYEDAQRLTETDWRRRAARATRSTWVAEAPDGRWVGTMSVFIEDGDAWLVAVYVAPDHRGRKAGVTDRLLDAAIEWGRDEAKVDRVLLEVREDNDRARGFYRRRGFVDTGRAEPYELDPAYSEVEMALSLSQPDQG